MDYVLRRALIGHLTLDAFGHQLHLILDVLLEIAICRPTRHRAYRSHAAIAFVGAPLIQERLSGCLLRSREQGRSEEHTSELQSLMRISYAVFCLKKKTKTTTN